MLELLRRLRVVMKGRRQDDDLVEELAFHQEMKERALESEGLSPTGVRDATRRALGNDLAARQYARDVWIAPWLQEIGQDIRFGARLLRRERGFAITAILVLGFGIGVNNMLFTILRAHTMRGLPIDRADRVLHISSFDERTADRGISFPEFEDLRTQAKSFTALAAFFSSPMALGDEGRAPDRFEAAHVSANAFAVLGIEPAFGRAFDEGEDRAGATPVVVLGTGAWESRYARDPAILGRTVLVNGAPFTVIGVMPPRSGFPSTAQVWLPLARAPGLAQQRRDARTLRVFGRLHDGASEVNARAEVESIVGHLSQEYPDTSRGNRARVVPINQRVLGRLTDPAWLAFMGFGFLALVMSSANAANLMLARALQRAREIGVRASLGATRARVVRQLLIESAVLAAAGSLLGIGVSLAGVRVFRTAIPPNTLPYWFEYDMDLPVLAALAGVAIAAVFIFGLVPAVYASKADVNRVLKSGGRGIVDAAGSRRWTSAFMALQLGITVVMLAYLVVDVQSPSNDLASDDTLKTHEVLTGTVTLPMDTYPTPDTRRAFYGRLADRLRTLPAVVSTALASQVPRRGATEQKVEVEGGIREAGQDAPGVATVAVGPRFFETLALPLERGREFVDRDAVEGANTVIVSRRLVELFFPDQDPIGKRIRLMAPTPTEGPRAAPTEGPREAPSQPWLTIVGVAQQVQHRQPRDPVAYVPFHAAAPATASLLLRTREAQSTMTTRLRESLGALDPNLPVYRVLTMAQVIDESTWNGRVASRLVRSITLIAFMFCIVGLYAVTAHAVAQRTNEIGIRMALGARPGHVAAMIVKRAALQVVFGLALGIAGVILWSSAFGPGRADTNVASPPVVAVIAALLAAATFVACMAPARRAMRLDPVSALRND